MSYALSRPAHYPVGEIVMVPGSEEPGPWRVTAVRIGHESVRYDLKHVFKSKGWIYLAACRVRSVRE